MDPYSLLGLMDGSRERGYSRQILFFAINRNLGAQIEAEPFVTNSRYVAEKPFVFSYCIIDATVFFTMTQDVSHLLAF